MVETLPKESVYSSERIETTKVSSPAEAAKPVESPEPAEPSQSTRDTLKTQMASLLDATKTRGNPSFAEFVRFLNQTKRVWLSIAAAVFGLIALFTLAGRLFEWARNTREQRHEQAIASVTPDRLIARCGQPFEDVTKDVYPILMRTISYQPDRGHTLLLSFSRTAEEHSDWVFLSMKDEGGAESYESPEAKIAALPCLDSKK